MKKTIALFFIIAFCNTFSQEKEKISITFNNTTLLNAIQLIEYQTDYKFFFIKNWVESVTVSKEVYTDTTLEKILDTLFKNTDLNYYIHNKNNIILTKNNIIYKSVYQPVLDTTKRKEQTIIKDKAPVFISKNKHSNIRTIKIGKENYNNQKKLFTLTGFVKNSVNNKPLANITIFIKKENIYTSTDKNGFYAIKIPYGAHILESKLIGYKKTSSKIVMYNDGKHNFNIHEDTEFLDEIVIEANLNKNTKSTQFGVQQLKAEKIKTIPLVLGERDILKVSTTLPGITNAGEGSDGINVRGGQADQNLFLLDGSVMYNPAHFLGLFSAINPFTTKGLEIYKGDIPVEFGGRISSVFDITSKKSKTDKFGGEASLGPVMSNISLEIPIVKNKSGLLLGFRSTYSNWILKAIKDKKLKNSSASFLDFIGKYDHEINKNNSINISTYYSNDSYSIASDSTNSYRNKIVSASWNHTFNDKNKSTFLVSNSGYDFDIEYKGKLNNNFNLKYNINESSLKFKMLYDYSKKHKINYGFTSKLYNISPGSITPLGQESIITPFSVQNERALESALFLSDQFKINKKLSINLGVRYNVFNALGQSTQRLYTPNTPISDASVTKINNYAKNEVFKTYTGLSMHFSSRYLINKSLSLKASIHNSYQYIHRLTNNTSASPTDIWKLSDINIKPQEAIQGAFGIFKNLDGNKYELSLETYYKKYKNILNYKVGSSFLLNEFIETEVIQGPGKSYGAEFFIKKNKGRLNGWISYSLSKSLMKLDSKFPEERINDGKFFPTNFDKPHILNVIANFKLTKRFSLSSNFTFQSGRPITYPTGKYTIGNSNYLLYSDVNKFRIPNYFRLDIGFNAEGNHKIKKIAHSFWNFSIYNLLGKNNPYSIFFVTQKGNIKAYQSSIFSSPIPTITYNFKF